MKTCKLCKREKPLTEFHENRNQCKECISEYNRKYHAANLTRKAEVAREWYKHGGGRESIRVGQLHRKYGLTVIEYDALISEQDGRCAIYTKRKKLVIDHCHQTGVVRGLLCSKCNTALGGFCDDPDLLQEAIEYLLRS